MWSEFRIQRSGFSSAARLAAFSVLAILFLPLNPEQSAAHATPIASDSRIKTFVYNANEVFSITTHYGYQSNIEFGVNEVIDTVSVGDRVGWQIVPAGRRLFIRAMEENAHTNMTIVTNQRAYQFDLRSSAANAVFGSEELTYVVRFFYPDEMTAGAATPIPYASPVPTQIEAPLPNSLVPTPVAPIMLAPAPSLPVAVRAARNYRYTYSGPSAIAPLKIYDDGHTTYLKLPDGGLPQIAILAADGQSMSVPARRTSDGMVAIDVVAPRFSLRQGAQQIIVYNELAG